MKTQSNRRLIRPFFLTLTLAAVTMAPAIPAPAQTAPAHVLPDGEVPPALQAARAQMLEQPENMLVFRNMDQLFETRVVARSGPVSALPRADTTLPDFDFKGAHLTEDQWEDATFTNALLVIRDGRIIHESYRNNSAAATHFISFSMAKSITSMLVGVALDKGLIHSIDQPATDFVPELKGSGYDGVTIRQLLQMRSGVDYEERYDFGVNPSTAAKIFTNAIVKNHERFADTALRQGRKWAPGSHFNYSTLDASVLGWVLERATHQPLASFMEQNLWEPMGMESYGFWLADGVPGVGRELNGMGYNAALRDYGRLGEMILDGGRFNGRQVVPASWVRQSTTMVPFDAGPKPDGAYGYGFQWWILDDTGAFSAWGLQGQFIYVHPASRTVIVKLSFFPPEGTPGEDAAMAQTLAYFKTLDNWSGGHVAP
jgi:hypothetical protein